MFWISYVITRGPAEEEDSIPVEICYSFEEEPEVLHVYLEGTSIEFSKENEPLSDAEWAELMSFISENHEDTRDADQADERYDEMRNEQ